MGSSSVFRRRVEGRILLTISRTSIVLFIISIVGKIASLSVRITAVLHHTGDPIVMITGGASGGRLRCGTPRFCGLKLNSPCYVSTVAKDNANSLVSLVINGFGGRSSRVLSSRVPHFTIIKHPGTNGSSVMGTFVNRSHGVIARVTKAAHSSVCAHCGGFKFSFCLISATNVHGGGGIGRSLRCCSIVHSVHTVRNSSMYVLVLSTAEKVRDRSLGVFSLVRGGRGKLIIIVGG